MLLRAQILHVRRARLDLDRHSLNHLQSIALDPDDLPGIIRDELDLVQTEIDENLRPDTVVTQVRLEAQFQICLNGIAPLILQPIGPDLVEQADAAPLLIQVPVSY